MNNNQKLSVEKQFNKLVNLINDKLKKYYNNAHKNLHQHHPKIPKTSTHLIFLLH